MNNKMRILHVTKKYPNALGGDAIVVQNLEKQQIKNGHEVFILTTNCDEIQNKKNLIKFGLKDSPEKLDSITLRRIFSLIGLKLKFPKILKEIKPDVVHCHSIDMGYILSKECKKSNIPLIQHMHCGLFTNKTVDKKRAVIEKFFLKHSNFKKIISVNPNDLGKLKNIIFIPNGVDLNVFKNSKKKKSDKINILFVGRVEKLKGLDYLIQAIKEISNKTKNIRLSIIGRGNDFDYYTKLVNSFNLQSYIRFLGQKNQNELIKYYSNSDIFVLPSLDEAFPIVVLEAWASGLPVISTNVGGISKVCKNNENALIIPLKNSKAIAEAMEKLIKDKKLRDKLGINGRKLVEEKYNWENISKALEEIYFWVLK